MPVSSQPITLTGTEVRLVPMTSSHLDALTIAGADPRIWEFTTYGYITSKEKMAGWIQEILRRHQHGTDLPFTIIHQPDEKIVGCTRFMEMQPEHGTLEIGGTWINTAYWRSAVNAESKLLLLQHAFEVFGCMRVQLKTDILNTRSQKAIERLGAIREGVHRNHLIRPDGSRRDSVYYSITDDEWPQVKATLLSRIQIKRQEEKYIPRTFAG